MAATYRVHEGLHSLRFQNTHYGIVCSGRAVGILLCTYDQPGSGVAVREFPLSSGFADYLLFVGGKAIGAIEAKAVGTPLSG